MLSILLASSFTFTAIATGVEKGTAVEFMFADKSSDRDYETMFLLEKPLDSVLEELRKTSLPIGAAPDVTSCVMWPEGQFVSIEPALTNYIEYAGNEKGILPQLLYTGGAQNEKGTPLALIEMPRALLSFYTLSQAAFVFDEIAPQGEVYGCFKARTTLKKGTRVSFTVTGPDQPTFQKLEAHFSPSNIKDEIIRIKNASQQSPISVMAEFDAALTIKDATAVAQMLNQIDSPAVKVNRCGSGNFFYRAFLPPVQWLDRQERMVQPFEVTYKNGNASAVFIEEDWTVDGPDPKLTEHKIALSDMVKHPKTDTAFIYCSPTNTIGELTVVKKQFPATVKNIYIYANNASLHNNP